MSLFRFRITVLLLLAFMLALPDGQLQAQPQPLPGMQEYHRQKELERQRREGLQDEAPDVRLQPRTVPGETLAYPDNESPCFVINEIILEGEEAERFQWALAGAEEAKGRCLGSQGFNVLMSRMQNLIVERGFVTTRLAAGPQDLTSGRLVLTLIPGRVRQVRLAEDSGKYIFLWPNIPVKPGDILNLRDVEQGLENLKRSPNTEADIRIVAGEEAGESDLVVYWKQTRFLPLRFSLGVDDSGSKYTGKMQGTATVSVDNLTGLSDMFYTSFSHNLERNDDFGTKAYSFYYSLPWGYNQLAFSTNYSTYHQTVAGYYVNYEYSGRSNTTSLELSRAIHRGSRSKTSVGAAAFASSYRNFIDDVELKIQRRRMGGWEAFLRHHHIAGVLTLDGELRYRRGTGAFRSLRAPEEDVREGTSRPSILNFSLRGQYPFQVAGQNFRYIGQWRSQWAFCRLIFHDRFSIGGRYSVRGYDGNMSLAADNGFNFRNELGWNVVNSGQELYLAFDVGHVRGPMDEYLLGRTLSGAAVGLRGAIKGLRYDFFASTPVHRPDKFPGNWLVTGFNVVWNF